MKVGRLRVTLVTLVAVLGTVLVTNPEPAAAAERAGVVAQGDWEGPIDSWTTWPFEEGQEICHKTGQIGVAFGAYKAYKCVDDGWFTTYLYVQYFP